MLHAYIGQDSAGARVAIRSAIERSLAASRDTRIEQFDGESFSSEAILDAVTSESLFGGATIVVLDGVAEREDGATFLEENAELLARSQNTVVVRESKPKVALERHLKEFSQLFKEFKPKKEEKREGPAVFALAEAFAAGDKRRAWAMYAEMREHGEEPEPIHGMLFWAAKALYLSRIARSEAEAGEFGVTGFSYRKYKGYAKDRDPEDLLSLVARLKDMYHDAHEGKSDLSLSLEQFLLETHR